MKKYAWKQISQWGIPDRDIYIQHREVDTGLSKETCTYILVKQTAMRNGVTTIQSVKNVDVTDEMLEIANTPD